MRRSSFAVLLAFALVSVVILGQAVPVAAAKPGVSKLTPAELAFASAVGTGTYAYGIDRTYAYDYGEIAMPLGEAWRGAGSGPAHEYARYLAKEMTRIGLSDVAKEDFPVHAYNYGGASVQIVAPQVGDVWLAAGHGGIPGTTKSPYRSPDGSITAEIVYVGLGTRFDYLGKDVTGKLVLIDVSEEEMFWLQYPLYEAELHGAIGAVVTWIEYADVEGSVATHDSEARPNIPAVSISHKDAATLRDLILTSNEPVKVRVWCDAEVDLNGFGYNVYGYLPGSTHPDEYMIIGDHYDKWWYGASDNGCGVARLLGIAKAMVDSGYRPERTFVFLATDAEEYGWQDAEFDWGLGAWWAIFVQHPDWAGRTRGYFNLEGGCDAGATSISAYGNPETATFRQGLLPLFDEWFGSHAPWSAYYYPAKVQTDSFPTTWADIFSFGAAGVPVMDISSSRSLQYSGYSYHTQMDTMEWVSGESLAMSIISNGFAAMELDRAFLVPYSFEGRADDLQQHLNTDAINKASVDTRELFAALSAYSRASNDLARRMASAKGLAGADLVNAKLMQAAQVLGSRLTWVGGYTESMYESQHYQDDAWFLWVGIQSLRAGNIDKALTWLSWVYGMYTGRLVSYENYRYLQLDRWNVDAFKQFWARGRIASIVDIWHEYDSLLQKKGAGISDYTDEIASLSASYEVVVGHLQDALNSMAQTMEDATVLLNDAGTLLGS